LIPREQGKALATKKGKQEPFFPPKATNGKRENLEDDV